MQAVIDVGMSNSGELAIINRFMCHQQVLFVSDALDAGGKCLNKYLNRRTGNEVWSTLIFPIQNSS